MLEWLSEINHVFVRLMRSKGFGVVLIVGLVTLLGVDIMLTRNIERERTFRQTLIAEKLQSQLKTAIEEHIAALVSINVVYQNFVDINSYDFQQYGKAITSHLHGFNRLLFIDPKFTIRQVYPATTQNQGLYGLSLHNNPDLVDLLTKAEHSRNEKTSALIPFLGGNKRFLAVLPIFRNRSEFIGFAMGDISLHKIWDNIPQTPSLTNYQAQLIGPHEISFFDGVRFSPDSPQTTVSFDMGDDHSGRREWRLILAPTGAAENMLLFQVTYWFFGLALLSLILFLVSRSNRHQAALGEAQSQFKTVFNASPDGILLLDNDLHFRLSNPAICQWTGKSEEELKRLQFFDVFRCRCPHLEKCREVTHLLCTGAQFKQDLPDTLEVDIQNKNERTPNRLRFNASRVKQSDSGEGFICLLGDITASKELEREKETYVATLTHDLKTPLLAQEMVLDSLLSGSAGNITNTQQKLLQASKQSVQDLLDMVNDSLLFYKIESSRLSIQKNPHGLSPLIQDVIQTLQPIADSRSLHFEIESSSNLPDPWVDAVQIKRAFHNILSNAVSYANRGSVIRVIMYAEPGERIIIEVKNEGKGILPEELPKIFDKYYSLSRKFKQIGTGLGLYISRRIVELHGGKIWAVSEPNKETSFFIALPYPQQMAAASA